jgi:hypothetical protein
MRLQLVIILMMMFSFYSKGQSYGLKEIKEEGNKYLKSFLQDTSIFQNCIPDEEINIKSILS